MARPRTNGRRDLPDNLVPRSRYSRGQCIIYWYWRDPRTGEERSLKCPNDRTTAIRRAKELNALVATQLADNLTRGIMENPDHTNNSIRFSHYALHCLELSKDRLAENSIRTRRSLTNAAIQWFGEKFFHEISVQDIVQLLNHYSAQGKKRYAQSLRAVLVDIWNTAIQEGIIPASQINPAKVTRRPDAKIQRARLTLDTFNEILQSAEELTKRRGAWIANSMLLALVTGQRREDLVIAQFRKGRDWFSAWRAWQEGNISNLHPYPYIENNAIWFIQQKTGMLVSIPLELKLEAIGLSVGDVIERCRSKIASRYLLHHTGRFSNAPAGSRISIDRVSHAFADARKLTDLEWPGKTPPTFHEIRSLSERLYKQQGVNTQILLGHRHASTTAIYDDPRQAEWLSVTP